MVTSPSQQGRLRVGRTGKGILYLISGTVAAQAVAFVILPLLSRIYTPDDFGYFSVVMAMVGIVSPVATLRYESAAMLPTALEEVRSLVWLAMGSVFAVSLVTFAGLQLAALQGWFGLSEYPWIGPWVSCLVALGAAFGILSQLAVRKRQYGLVAQRSLLRSILTGVVQLGTGWAARLPAGLLVGSAVGSLGGLVTLWRNTREFLEPPPRGLIRSVVRHYWKFPAIFAPSALLNSLGLQVPLLFLTAVFGLSVGGQLGMAERIVAVPVALVGGAVTQAIDAEVAERIRCGQHNLHAIFWKFSSLLGAAALAVALGGVALGGIVVPLLLGSDWVLAGALVQILAVTSAVRLVASPLSKFLLLLQRSTANVVLDVLRVGLVGLAMAAVLSFELELKAAAWVIYAALAITYAAIWVYVLMAVRDRATAPTDVDPHDGATGVQGN